MKDRSAKTSLPTGSKRRHRDTSEENEPQNRERAKKGVSSQTKNLQTSTKAVLPRWGGNATFKGVRIFMQNTCPIDNLLYILYRVTTERADIHQSCSNKNGVTILPVSHKFERPVAVTVNGQRQKSCGLNNFCGCTITTKDRRKGQVTWNAYGSEYDKVIQHLQDIQSSRQSSSATNKMY